MFIIKIITEKIQDCFSKADNKNAFLLISINAGLNIPYESKIQCLNNQYIIMTKNKKWLILLLVLKISLDES